MFRPMGNAFITYLYKRRRGEALFQVPLLVFIYMSVSRPFPRLFYVAKFLQFFNSSILPLGACDAFLRSIGAQALRGGLAKNFSIFQSFNSSILQSFNPSIFQPSSNDCLVVLDFLKRYAEAMTEDCFACIQAVLRLLYVVCVWIVVHVVCYFVYAWQWMQNLHVRL